MRSAFKNRTYTILAALLLTGAAGCGRPPELARPGTAAGRGSSVQLEIRYNAVRALAYRGSAAMKDPAYLDLLAEMLDEEQQQKNFWLKLKDGREVPDLAEAQTTVISGLKAVAELHRKRNDIDLSRLRAAVEKVGNSENEVVRQEARKTRAALGMP
jgi:hypothetical protein